MTIGPPSAVGSAPDTTALSASMRRVVAFELIAFAALALSLAVCFWSDRLATAAVREAREVSRLTREAHTAVLEGDAEARGTPVAGRAAAAQLANAVLGKLDSLQQLTAGDGDARERSIALRQRAEAWRTALAAGVVGDGRPVAGWASRELRAALTAFAAWQEAQYRQRISVEDTRRRIALAAVLAELLIAAALARRAMRHLHAQSDALTAQHMQLAVQNETLAGQRDQLLEQREQLETQAVDLEEHSAELEVTNLELAEAIREVEATAGSLVASESRYRHLFEHNPLPMWVYDTASLRILAVNDSAVTSYGYSRDEFLSLTLEALRPPEDAGRVRAAAASTASDERLHHDRGWKHRRKDGSIIDVEIASHGLLLDGRPARLVLAIDVTARLAAERELRRASDLLRAVIDESPLAILVLDPELVIQRWNRAATRLLGGSAEERIGTPYARLVPADRADEHARLRAGLVAGRIATNVLTQRCRLDGSLAEVSLSLAALGDDRGGLAGVVVVLADVQEQRQLEDQLRQAQKMEAVGQLAGGVAHDFNNLLTVISSYSELVLVDLPSGSPACEDVQEIRAAAERAAKLTRQLLAFSRQQVLHPQPIALHGVIANLEKMLRRLVPADIAIVSALHAEHDTVEADQGQVEQVLVNLVVNARDAMAAGGTVVLESRNVVIGAGSTRGHDGAFIPPGTYLRLGVRDTGTGISAETQARMFEPFYTTKPAGKGTGLGLSTVYGIIKQSGGHLAIASELGVGTTFFIYLPVAASGPAGVSEAPGPAAEAPPRGESVLVVEDDASLRKIACRSLSRAGFTVLAAPNGREALELLAANGTAIDLVITDMVMPEMNGHELLHAVRRQHPAARLMLMSGYAPDMLAQRGLSDTSMAFLEKPFTPLQLISMARQLLSTESS